MGTNSVSLSHFCCPEPTLKALQSSRVSLNTLSKEYTGALRTQSWARLLWSALRTQSWARLLWSGT